MTPGDPYLTLQEIMEIARKARFGETSPWDWRRRAGVWHGRRPDLCIKRDGVRLYHLTLLPKEMQKAALALLTPPMPTADEQVATGSTRASRARVRDAIKAYARKRHLSQSAAIDAFMKAVELAEKSSGGNLNAEVEGFGLKLSTLLNARERRPSRPQPSPSLVRPKVSRRTLFYWLDAAAPPHLASSEGMEGDWRAASRIFMAASDELLEALIRAHEPRIRAAMSKMDGGK